MISRRTIDAVFEAARVEEVIGDFIQLKRAGSNMKGLSPFTNERTPSFMVSPVKQIWKDFSSGKGGNVISFLMEHEHFSYPEAIRFLAKKYGIEVEETQQTDEEKEQANERESLYLVSEFARDYFHNTLLNSEEGKAIGLSYFKERGFSEETIRTFQLGYSPDQWQAFTDHALEEGYSLEFLEKSGLTVVRKNEETGHVNQFDRFKGRVMFPIFSMSGRTLGFGARILDSQLKTAKYLNSPESDIYHKSKVLYGLYHAKRAIAAEDNCYLVEGYTDVIQMFQSGIENVVASSGTALTPQQIRLINRLTKNITVLFDGDAAGLRASIRGIDLILEEGLNVKICSFPEGEDPDSFSRKNDRETIRTYLEEHAMDFITFKASLLAEEAKNDPVKKSETIHDIVVSISKIPDAIKREVYARECSRIMDISEEVLFNTLAQLLRKLRQDRQKRRQSAPAPFEVITPEKEVEEKIDKQLYFEEKILELLILYGDVPETFEEEVLVETEDGSLVYKPEVREMRVFEKVFLDLQSDETEFTNDRFKALYEELMKRFRENPDAKAASFVNQIEPEMAAIISDVLMEDERYTLHDWRRNEIIVKEKSEGIARLVNDTIWNLRRYLVSKKIDELAGQIEAEPETDTREVVEEVMLYISLRKLLSKKLDRVI